jgi:hypothetical protein
MPKKHSFKKCCVKANGKFLEFFPYQKVVILHLAKQDKVGLTWWKSSKKCYVNLQCFSCRKTSQPRLNKKKSTLELNFQKQLYFLMCKKIYSLCSLCDFYVFLMSFLHLAEISISWDLSGGQKKKATQGEKNKVLCAFIWE